MSSSARENRPGVPINLRNRRFLEIKGMTPTDFRRQSASRFGIAETH